MGEWTSLQGQHLARSTICGRALPLRAAGSAHTTPRRTRPGAVHHMQQGSSPAEHYVLTKTQHTAKALSPAEHYVLTTQEETPPMGEHSPLGMQGSYIKDPVLDSV